MISHCFLCSRVLPSQLFTPMVTSPPSTHLGHPMQHVGLDLFSFGGKQYLICVDHWSGYPLYSALRSLSSEAITSILSSWFNLLGWPTSIRSDGGPQFRGPFSTFCSTHHITHELSAQYNRKSNVLAEAGVKSVKNILRKCHQSGSNPDTMLYEWQNVPCSDGFSSAQLLFGRRQRTSLPLLPCQNKPIKFHDAAVVKDKLHPASKSLQGRHKIDLPFLQPSQKVYIQDPKSCLWDSFSTVLSIRPDRLSYNVLIADRTFLRPRRLLRPSSHEHLSPSPSDSGQITTPLL